MNNDTPQVFGDDTHDHPRDAYPRDPGPRDPGPRDPGPLPDQDGEDFPPFRGWDGWGERVEPVGPDDEYPPPSFAVYEPPSHEPAPYLPPSHEPVPYEPPSHEPARYLPPSHQPEYPHRPAPGEPGYPPGPGYAPDSGYARDLGYPRDPEAGVRYLPDGYAADLGFAEDPGYHGFGRDAEPVPAMEPLPDPAGQSAMPAPVLLPPLPPRGAVEIAPPPLAEAVPEGIVLPGAVAPDMDMPLPTRIRPGGPAGADGYHGFRDQVLAPPPVMEPEYERETSDSLTTESLLHGKRAAPGSGWRRSVYRATGGLLRFGESTAEMRRRDLINRVRTPVAGGHHRVAVLSLKGGVGKTTTAVGLGATLATLRGDRVIALDANPDRGTLSDKVRLETAATIRDLLNERDQVSRYADVRAFTSQAPSRLEVLASDRDPGVSVAFGADDYSDAAQMLEHFYSICITDCGTGLLHSAMSGVLRLADQIILVSSPSVDGARSASATLDWLEAHNCADLVRNGVVVLSAIRPRSKSTVDLDRLEHHFASRCRAVARIPYDPHLEEGAEIELELLASDTAEAYLALAAVVGDGLAWPRRLTSRSGLP
jgi:MinD-like ATPase involved in chromosome partitioning or flagellar assembly